MSQEIYSGSMVEWPAVIDGQKTTMRGQVLNLMDLTKSADGSQEGIARIRVHQQGQPLDQVSVVDIPALTLVREEPTAVTKSVRADNLDKSLATMTQEDRNELARRWFAETGPRLPSLIVGEQGPREAHYGVASANPNTLNES